MYMNKKIVDGVLVLFIGIGLCVKADDPGFNLFFTTNTKELTDVPINFNPPLPSWLNGTLLRTGLGRFEMGKRNFTHAFDAYGKLYSWKFPGNGTAFFSTKFLLTDFLKESLMIEDIAPYLLFEGVVPHFDEFQKLEALIRGLDNMNVNIYKFFNEKKNSWDFFALNDYWKIYEVNPLSLETIGPVTADIPKSSKGLSGAFLSFLSSAHPLPEMGTNNRLTFLSSVSLIPGVKSKMNLIRIKSAYDREVIASWDVDRVPYMHSFSVTESYAIILASPYFVNVEKMVKYAEPVKALDWHDDLPSIVYVVSLKTGTVSTLTTENIFAMHHVNAYELDKENVIVDISSYPNPDFVKSLELLTLRDTIKRNEFNAHALLKRLNLNMTSRSINISDFEITSEVPYAVKLDMPTINENYRYRKYCFVYGLVLKKDDVKLSHLALVKKDVCKNNDKSWFVPNHYPLEAWFVPTPGDNVEDDGILMSIVLDGDKKQSYLAIIDGKSMTTRSVACLPVVVPFGMHGRFFTGVV